MFAHAIDNHGSGNEGITLRTGIMRLSGERSRVCPLGWVRTRHNGARVLPQPGSIMGIGEDDFGCDITEVHDRVIDSLEANLVLGEVLLARNAGD